MTNDRRRIILTTHVRERFLQRTNKKYNHLDDCYVKDCPKCQELSDEVKQIAESCKFQINNDIWDRLCEAEEERSYLNNTVFMAWYYNKYGYDKTFEFLIDKNILFVVVHDVGRKVAVTCISSKHHVIGKNHKKNKFSHIKKKEDKNQEILTP
jgi:hypothetical protein